MTGYEFDDVIQDHVSRLCRRNYPINYDDAKKMYTKMFFGNFQHSSRENWRAAVAVAGRAELFEFLEPIYQRDKHVTRIALLKAVFDGDADTIGAILANASQTALEANADLVEHAKTFT